ncbi:putative Xaa-Pro aminopeptidase, partial [Pleomassaria siparia CBS 279.74]
ETNQYWLHLEAGSPLEKYPAKQHARCVQEKLGADHGLIYLPGEPARNNEDSDMPAPFRQRRYFYYLSGCNEPNCHLTYDIENDSLALFIPRIDPARVIWNGRGSTPAEARDRYDIDHVFYIDELQDFLQYWARVYRGRLFILHPSQNPLIPGIDEPVDTESLQPAMALARVIKDDHEISLIKKANDISSQAHREVLANITRFNNEAQVEGLFLDVCVSKRAKQQAYDPIAASGPNAGTLHYDANDQDFGDRQLMCLDAGCEWQLYASDITRTFPLSGHWPSDEARNIYQLVQRMQETCIQALKPGVRYLDLHIKAHQIAIDGLLALGILHNGTREEIYKAGTSKAFFPHGLGHHVGLEVHDVGQGSLMSVTKGNPKYEMAPSVFPKDFHLSVFDPELCRSPVDVLSGHLEPGMVVTVEPGIYFSTYALNMFYLPSPIHSKFINTKVVARYLPVGGVRIEDDILITSKGYKNLSTAPKGEAMLEIIRSQNAQWPLISDLADLGPIMRETDVEKEEEPLLRAPGFPKHTQEPIIQIKPIVRSATAPVKRVHGRKSADSGDLEKLEGPALITDIKRSRTTDENVQQWRVNRKRTELAAISSPRTTICGENSPSFIHTYMGLPVEHGEVHSISLQPAKDQKPRCRNCAILVEAVDRLRDSLNKSEKVSP